MKEPAPVKSDLLIIGTGIAGLALSLYLDSDLKVNIITKSSAEESSSFQAQGGIACVTDVEDSFEEHIQDTLDAGDGLCNLKSVETVIKAAPQAIEDIEKWGVEFTGGNLNPELGREGGHSRRRILYREDRTGAELETKLLDKVRSKQKIYENHTAVNLIMKKGRCIGAYVLDNTSHEIKSFYAKAVILATGGCGKAYLYTTNPHVATGDGVAMAYRAGASIANMEFIQFHPTSLFSSQEESFLITEAMRGEGALLKNSKGEVFMKRYDPRENLAPRDIVARAIDSEMKREGVKHLYLDIHSVREPDFIRKRFPSIYKKLKGLGIDITQEDIPVVPSAHYCCGGVDTDSNGLTDIEGLFAVGETAHTGLHGANRLASNSLLEALVYARRAAEKIPAYISNLKEATPQPWTYTGNRLPEEKIFIEHNWESVRRIMWNYVGIVRSNYRLKEAEKRLELIANDVNYHYWNYLITPGLVELRNLVDVARIIVKSASMRKESRGLNYNVDHPEKREECRKNTYIRK
ncbi:MAG: L-aspartate oxidase [Elusimicrobia bacterium]|nr:L-aspartate oxidase [Elusimicrobiota bacterium]